MNPQNLGRGCGRVQYLCPCRVSKADWYLLGTVLKMRWRHSHVLCFISIVVGNIMTSPGKSRQAACSGRCSYFCWLADGDEFENTCGEPLRRVYTGPPRLINAVESTKLNSTVERYCLHSSTKVNEAVDFKMAANELGRDDVVVICDYLMKECQHI